MKLALAAVLCAACATPAPPPAGRVVVALTMDWEGVELAPDGFAAVDGLRARLGGDVPITHFVSAAYATRTTPPGRELAAALDAHARPEDEVAVHLHGWASLARAAGVAPKTAPSFFTGTEELLSVIDTDVGFDLDLDAYEVGALRALVATSRQLLAQGKHPVSASFRAGGYLTTPKLLLALGDEGIAVDSSAVEPRQLAGQGADPFVHRLTELWPGETAQTQPFRLRGGARRSVVELPIAAIVDDMPQPAIAQLLAGARARLRANPERDVFVVLAFHLETANDFVPKLAETLAAARDDRTVFVTVERAAELARFVLPAGDSG